MVVTGLLSSGVTVTIGGLGAIGIYLTGLAVDVGLVNNCLLAESGTGDEYRSCADSGENEPSEDEVQNNKLQVYLLINTFSSQ